jgi:5'-methylthioadenosine phosphorylase
MEVVGSRAVPEAEIGVIGNGKEVNPLEGSEPVEIETPYGAPSGPIAVGEIDGKRVAFLLRRGEERDIAPPQIPNRANLWALKELGVRRVVGVGACGALRMECELGDLVIFDQFVDRTWGRDDSFYLGHATKLVSEADPFCRDLGNTLVATARELDFPVHPHGTVVVIQGPRFATRAESELYRMVGWDFVDMVTYPECHLARELEICYAHVAMITDFDVGVVGAGAVTGATIARVFAQKRERVVALLEAALPRIGPQPQDECATALALAEV